MMKFYQSREYQAMAQEHFLKWDKILKENLGNVVVEHIGASSVDGLISKGDLDIYVEIEKTQFEIVISKILELGFKVKEGSYRSDELCPFYLEKSDIDIGLQLVARHSEFEDFKKFREKLKTDCLLRDQYNALKVECSGLDENEYRRIKSIFIEGILKECKESFNLSTRFDKDLKEIPSNLSEIKVFCALEKLALDTQKLDQSVLLKRLSNLGSFFKLIGKFDEGEDCFGRIFKLLKKSDFSEIMVYELRYADLKRYKKEFKDAEEILIDLIDTIEDKKIRIEYLDFCYQHLAKNYFDQGDYELAKDYFLKAQSIRIQKKDLNLIQSTKQALLETDRRIKIKKVNIRKADISDAKKIHEAHMCSIQEVCSANHSEEEIKAWGHRLYNEEQRVNAIKNQFVYVAEIDNQIEGHLHFNKIAEKNEMYVFAIYLKRSAIGLEIGMKFINILFDECKKQQIHKIQLHSTITAHDFYQKLGFVDTAPMTTVLINQTPIRCIPMEIVL